MIQDSKTASSPLYRARSNGLELRHIQTIATCALFLASFLSACDQPHTDVVLDNNYQPSATPLVVYRALWQAISFQTPVAPGFSSDPQSTVPASANSAYVLLAPGWDPTSSTPPTSFIAMQSLTGFEVHSNNTLHIPVNDSTFVGNCVAGSFLTQGEADFITQHVFRSEFTTLSYNAASCTTSNR